MTVQVQEAGPFERIVSFTVSESELEAAKTKTARRLSREVKIRGFRPGKAPRPIVEAAVGTERLRSEAIDDLLPEKVGAVLDDTGLRPAVSPRLEQVSDIDEGGVAVDLRVTLWPTLETIPEHVDRRIVVDSPEVTEAEIDEQIERIRDQYAALETVDRAAGVGDYVALDISAVHDGSDVPEARATQILYEVGSRGLIDDIDDLLDGVAAGESVIFDSTLPGGFGDLAGLEVTFTVMVTEVREKILPELTDEWVDEASEFETVPELRGGLRSQLEVLKRREIASVFREKALNELVEQVEIELPDALVRAEMDEILHEFGHRLEEQGISLDDYFTVAGVSGDVFVDDLRRQAETSLRTRLLLEAVGDREGVEVTDDEIDALVEAAARTTDNPAQARLVLAQPSRRKSLAGDILRNRALDAIVGGAIPVDEEGNTVDLEVDIDVFADEVSPDEVSPDEVWAEEVSADEVLIDDVLTDEVLGDNGVAGGESADGESVAADEPEEE